jgi:hypothetical protein
MFIFEWVYGWFRPTVETGDVNPSFFYEWADDSRFHEWADSNYYEWTDRR